MLGRCGSSVPSSHAKSNMRLDCGGFKPRSSEQLTPSPAQEVECRKGAGSRVGRAAGCQLRLRRGGVESHRLAPSERTRRPEERKQERGRSPLGKERRAPDGRAGQIETAVAWQLAKWQGTTNTSAAPSDIKKLQQHNFTPRWVSSDQPALLIYSPGHTTATDRQADC